MTTVAGVGLAVLDLVFSVPEVPARGEKMFVDGFAQVGGGPAANAAVTVSALGGRARYIGRLGDDAIGDQLVAGLEARTVDTSLVRRVQDVPSPVSAVMVEPSGDRTLVNHADDRLFVSNDEVTEADLAGADAVLTDLRWPRGGESSLRVAADLGLPGIVDFDEAAWRGSPDSLELGSHIVFSAGGLTVLSGTADPQSGLAAARRLTDAWIAVTAGADGVFWLGDDGELRHLPAFAVEAVDTLAAGDVFHGAFALNLAEGRPIEEALRRSSATAALKCTRFGGRDGIPTLAEVESFLETPPPTLLADNTVG